jgi:carbon-monoxide dehydrogenase large subunit
VIGAALRRVEDDRFLAGSGQFIADLSFPGELHCVFVRSPHAHARIRSIRSSGLIFTGKDLEGVHPMRCGWVLPGMIEPPRWALAREVVRHVGEPVAMVLAESRTMAEDLAEQVAVDYEPLPLIDGERAFAWTRGERQAVEQAMARASRRSRSIW